MVQLTENAATEKIIELQDVRFSYSSRQAPVLDIPYWQVSAGQQVFVHGPSGCGKTTLLNLLTGMLTPNRGSIRLLKETISALGGHQRDRFRARHIGLVFQQFNLISYLSVADNIRLAAHFGKHADKPNNDALAALLEQLQMPEALLKQRADQLSVGQQQRVAIARALINRPEVLIVDEPTSALDSDASAAFMKLLLGISRDSNSTLLFVSHDQRLAADFDETLNLTELNQAKRHAA